MSESSTTMEDNLSIKSSDSVTTSGEYEIVPEAPEVNQPAKSPTLNIANNGDLTDLEKNMHEVIHELDQETADVVRGRSHLLVQLKSTVPCHHHSFFGVCTHISLGVLV